MSSKDSAQRWLAGILLISALGLGFAIYNETSRPVTQEGSLHAVSAPELTEQPAVDNSASAPVSPLTLLLNNRRRHPASADQGPPNAQLDLHEPALAAEMPSDTAAPGSPIEPARSVPKSQATEKGPPGTRISPENLGRDVEPLRADPAPAGPTSPR